MPTNAPTSLDLILRLLIAAGLSMVIGAEREFFRKAAGMRTATLVGTGSALFMVISKYGFFDTAVASVRGFDGSRVAAQIVSGIGFLGAGLIFVQRDSVRGLTTAASIWVAAGLGMAVGAGMYVVSVGVTLLYLLASFGIRPLSQRMPHSKGAYRTVRVTYPDGQGMLRTIMETIGRHNVVVADMRAQGVVDEAVGDSDQAQLVEFELRGVSWAVEDMIGDLNVLSGVSATASGGSNAD